MLRYLILVFLLKILESGASFHSLSAKELDINGNKFDFESLEGKAVLVVNVASDCGYTDSHYKQLQELYEELQPTGSFVILGYPCNQFGGQEPGNAFQIKKFTQNYSVTFPIMQKVDVIGENMDPVWKFLAKSSGVTPTWNFYKYLLDGNGDLINVWSPTTSVKEIADTVRTVVHQEQLHQIQVERPDSPFLHDEF